MIFRSAYPGSDRSWHRPSRSISKKEIRIALWKWVGGLTLLVLMILAIVNGK